MITDLLLEAFAFEPISQRFTKNYAVDVTDSARIIEIALLGHTKETVDVSIADGEVRVLADPKENESYLIEKHSFKFNLPDGTDVHNVTGEVNNGILKITLPFIKKESKVQSIKLS